MNQTSERYWQFLRSVSIRADYYSLDGFNQIYFRYLQEKKDKNTDDLIFELRPMTEEEQNMVNVDTVSNGLGLSIPEITGRRCVVVHPFKDDNYILTLIISPYFLYCRVEKKDDEIKFADLSKLFQKYINFVPFAECLTPVMIKCIFHSMLYCPSSEDTKTVFRAGAFPLVSEGPNSARYADFYKPDDILGVDLIRNYRKGTDKNANLPMDRYIIEAISSCHVNDIHVEKDVPRIINTSAEYTSRCYNHE